MFLLYHLLFNCQYIFSKKFKFFYSFILKHFILEFSENSDYFSVILHLLFPVDLRYTVPVGYTPNADIPAGISSI